MYLRELRERGYEGGISILKDWLAEQHPAIPAPPIVRFETPPGRQAQADWTAIRRGRNKLSAFVGTLGFSRLSFVWFADNEGTVRNSVCGWAVEHYAAMALMKRSPKMTANWAFAMDHSRGGIFHSFSDLFKMR